MKESLDRNNNRNVIFEKVTDSTITINFNGEITEVRIDFEELKAAVEKLKSPTIQVGEKIYNISEIGQAEFNTIVNQYHQVSKPSYYLRLFLYVLVPLLAIVVAYLLYRNWQLKQPIVLTVAVNNLTPNPNLPLEKANITIVYGDKTETQEVKDEAIFKGIPANFRDEQIKILFQSEGFKPIDTSLVLFENHITLPVKRDDTFARIFGIVKEYNNGKRLENVTISVQDINVVSDKEGIFNILVPFEKQFKQQRVRANKEGYEEWDHYEPITPNEETVIYLQKKNL